MSLFNTSYSIILPSSHGEFSTEWKSCIEQLLTIASDNRFGIFRINIFISSVNSTEYIFRKKHISESIFETFGDCPAFAVLAITPGSQFNVTIEAGKVRLTDTDIHYRKHNDIPYSVLQNGDYKELWVNGIESKVIAEDPCKAARSAFDIMYQILAIENLTFDNIIRQWNYIGEILDTGNNNSELVRNYQLFNNVRFEYYKKFRKVKGYPAATGVGMNYKGVMIDFCAVQTSKGMNIFSVGNPQQKDPFNYDQIILADSVPACQTEKHPPLFERAKLIADQNGWRLFVSGTASILGQETTAVGNLEEQTRVTIENIKKLTSFENISSYYPQVSYTNPLQFSYFRVYIKNISDVEKVKSVCNDFFTGVPAVYIQSHICRTNLLVEIEAEVSS